MEEPSGTPASGAHAGIGHMESRRETSSWRFSPAGITSLSGVGRRRGPSRIPRSWSRSVGSARRTAVASRHPGIRRRRVDRAEGFRLCGYRTRPATRYKGDSRTGGERRGSAKFCGPPRSRPSARGSATTGQMPDQAGGGRKMEGSSPATGWAGSSTTRPPGDKFGTRSGNLSKHHSSGRSVPRIVVGAGMGTRFEQLGPEQGAGYLGRSLRTGSFGREEGEPPVMSSSSWSNRKWRPACGRSRTASCSRPGRGEPYQGRAP